MVSNITSVQPMSYTPSQLLDKFKQGERPEFQNNSDKPQQELEALAEQYKQTLCIDKKVELLGKEREMLYDEVMHPELTLARNYDKISKMMPKDFSPKETEDTLRLFDITALCRIERLGGVYKHKTPEQNIDTLANAYKSLDETNRSGKRARSFIITLFSNFVEFNPEYKEKITKTYEELSEVTADASLKESILSCKDGFDERAALDSLKINPNQDYLFRTLILKGSRQNDETKDFITTVLKSGEAEPDIYRSAVLGAGRFRSDENFEIIKNIALDKSEQDLRKREFALHSTALYIKDKPEEVKEIMQTVSRENSVFAPLGRILFDKVTGNYHGQKDRELKYAGYNKKQAARFKSLYNRFYQSDVPLNVRKENTCHLNILPFRKQLGGFVNRGMHYIVQHDTYTKQAHDSVGKRYFYENAGIYNSGDFMDAFDGINAKKYNMMNHYRVQAATHQNQMAHENGHSLHRMFGNSDIKTLKQLYRQAMKENRVLDYYAAANPYEYFAQGCDAIASVYKPHKEILANNPLAHTVYELMDKDPELYKFIKKSMKKYR